ncbi:hypothetical protein ACH5RR_011592 [Cinchona calisaya]|uniref:BHLH domain-containing protein n=1 Tax=Cinchona calisaya TaxID=153742 RepID=A0ABD3A5C4_9GENT
MDYSQAKLFSESETNMEDHPAQNHEWRMKSTHLSAMQLKSVNYDGSSYTSGQNTIHKASSSASTNMISFGNSKSSPRTANQQNGCPKFTVKDEAEEMLPLGNNISFSSPPISQTSIEELGRTMGYDEQGKRRGGSGSRTCLQAQEHVLAERKRREQLTRQFIALSSLIPGLEKLDKSSILGGAIKYIKEIEEEKKRKNEDSTVSPKKHRLSSYDDTSSSDENFDSFSLDSSDLKIEVRISDENVVFIIDCKEHKGITEEISRETNKHHLRVISTSSMPLGNSKILITILAQMDEGFSVTAKDLANNIRMSILNLM